MVSNISFPEWLTDEEIQKMKQWIKDCPNPYTEKEISQIEYDGYVDIPRLKAYEARRILIEYGIIFDETA